MKPTADAVRAGSRVWVRIPVSVPGGFPKRIEVMATVRKRGRAARGNVTRAPFVWVELDDQTLSLEPLAFPVENVRKLSVLDLLAEEVAAAEAQDAQSTGEAPGESTESAGPGV